MKRIEESRIGRRGRMILIRLAVIAAICAVTVLPVLHFVLVFPGALIGSVVRLTGGSPKVPEGVTARKMRTPDGAEIDVWYLPAGEAQGSAQDGVKPHINALFFHGNGGDMKNFFSVQQWLSSIGIGSYSFDYRGFGRSSGWPNEEKLYRDSAQVLDLIVTEDKVPLSSLLFVGMSLGCAPAAQLAVEHEPAAMLLLSPFTSLDEMVERSPRLRVLKRWLWWHFPVTEFVRRLDRAPLIVAHGDADGLIPPELGRMVTESYRGKGVARFISVPRAGHNDLFFRAKGTLTGELAALGLTAASAPKEPEGAERTTSSAAAAGTAVTGAAGAVSTGSAPAGAAPGSGADSSRPD